jgi:hypothetical protein
MKTFWDALLTFAVLGGILIISFIFTNWFTHRMYYQCSQCRALNAKRRSHCRMCGNELTTPK